MRVEFVLLADAAEAVNGKVYMLGGVWNLFRAAAFPAQATMAWVASILADSSEKGKYPVTVTLVGPDNVPVVPPVRGELEVGDPTPGASPSTPHRTLVALTATVPIPRTGHYTLTVEAGNASASTVFEAILVGTHLNLPVGGTAMNG